MGQKPEMEFYYRKLNSRRLAVIDLTFKTLADRTYKTLVDLPKNLTNLISEYANPNKEKFDDVLVEFWYKIPSPILGDVQTYIRRRDYPLVESMLLGNAMILPNTPRFVLDYFRKRDYTVTVRESGNSHVARDYSSRGIVHYCITKDLRTSLPTT